MKISILITSIVLLIALSSVQAAMIAVTEKRDVNILRLENSDLSIFADDGRTYKAVSKEVFDKAMEKKNDFVSFVYYSSKGELFLVDINPEKKSLQTFSEPQTKIEKESLK